MELDFHPYYCFFLHSNSNSNCICMAPNLRSSLSEISPKPYHNFLLFFGLLFLLIALANSSSSDDHLPNSTPATTTTVNNFEPQKGGNLNGKQQYEVRDHEVPSGPNPISNR